MRCQLAPYSCNNTTPLKSCSHVWQLFSQKFCLLIATSEIRCKNIHKLSTFNPIISKQLTTKVPLHHIQIVYVFQMGVRHQGQWLSSDSIPSRTIKWCNTFTGGFKAMMMLSENYGTILCMISVLGYINEKKFPSNKLKINHQYPTYYCLMWSFWDWVVVVWWGGRLYWPVWVVPERRLSPL